MPNLSRQIQEAEGLRIFRAMRLNPVADLAFAPRMVEWPGGIAPAQPSKNRA